MLAESISQAMHARRPCIVSERWLRFKSESRIVDDDDLLTLDVMTGWSGNDPRKLCQLTVTRSDLVAVLGRVRPTAGPQ